jgi:hypothetical protein
MVPDKGALFEWASFLAVALFIVRALYDELRRLIVIVALDVQQLSQPQRKLAGAALIVVTTLIIWLTS